MSTEFGEASRRAFRAQGARSDRARATSEARRGRRVPCRHGQESRAPSPLLQMERDCGVNVRTREGEARWMPASMQP